LIANELQVAIECALSDRPDEQRFSVEIAAAIAASAISDAETGRQVITFDPNSETLMRYDLVKAITAAAAVLGTTISVVAAPIIPLTLAGAALSCVGALAGVKGVRSEFPPGCAQIVIILVNQKDRRAANNELRRAFILSNDTRRYSNAGFDDAVFRLREMGCIRILKDEVQLVERVYIRR
jgi:hypothetical protein